MSRIGAQFAKVTLPLACELVSGWQLAADALDTALTDIGTMMSEHLSTGLASFRAHAFGESDDVDTEDIYDLKTVISYLGGMSL